jgi:SAM-dependent methyltransferase
LLSAHIDRAAISLVIDLGCGTGRFSEVLAAHFGAHVIGVDPSEKMVDQARRKPATGNVDYRQGTAEALPLPDGAPTSYSCRRDIESVFAAGGFTRVVHQVVTQVTAREWPSFIEKSALRADSLLARLSDDDFQQGMAALRTPGDAINQNDDVTEEIDWFVFLRHG